MWLNGTAIQAQRQRLASGLEAQVAQLDAVRARASDKAAQADVLRLYVNEYERAALPVDVSAVIATVSSLMPASVVLDTLRTTVIEQVQQRSAMETLQERVKRSRGEEESRKEIRRLLEGELIGTAWKDSDFAVFLERLAQHPLFMAVQLDYDRSRDMEGVPYREFRVRFEIDLEARYIQVPVQGVDQAGGQEL
ncbi:MAG: hypothetical protein D8M59_11050 [Planctomycetes bacterium]|nr:hypothetical protein [Planctomycetota bacterium]